MRRSCGTRNARVLLHNIGVTDFVMPRLEFPIEQDPDESKTER